MGAPAGSPPPGHRLSRSGSRGGMGESRARKLNPEAVWAVPPKVRLMRKMLERAFLDPLRGSAHRVPDLQPRAAAAVLVRPVAPLRCDAFEPEPAGVREHGAAVRRLDVLDHLDAVARSAQQARERSLTCRQQTPRRVLRSGRCSPIYLGPERKAAGRNLQSRFKANRLEHGLYLRPVGAIRKMQYMLGAQYIVFPVALRREHQKLIGRAINLVRVDVMIDRICPNAPSAGGRNPPLQCVRNFLAVPQSHRSWLFSIGHRTDRLKGQAASFARSAPSRRAARTPDPVKQRDAAEGNSPDRKNDGDPGPATTIERSAALAKHVGTDDDAAQCRCFQQSDISAGHGRLHEARCLLSSVCDPE